MNKNRFHNFGYRMLVALLSVSLLVGPAAGPAYAAQTALGDIPIASKVTAKPNVVYSLDDSGSMQFNYLPDWVIAAQGAAVSISKILRAGAVATATVVSTASLSTGQYVTIYGPLQPEYTGSFQITVASPTTFTFAVSGAPITPATVPPFSYTVGTGYCRSGSNATACTANNANYTGTFQSPPFYAADFNRLAYNPNVNYTPPVKADGNPLTHTIGTDTDALGNQAFFAKVQTDPFTSPGTNVTLVPAVAVPLYCNTDWPLTAGANLALNPDVGDAFGEYKAGSGGWCRINGTKYDLSVASGAPAVVDDYNYPYQSSTGATGTQYFYKQLGNKILYCDTTSPYYPRNPAVITACVGAPPIMGVPPVTKQTCNAVAKTCNPVVGSRTWSQPVPPPCAANALYCAPGTGGSDGNSIGTGSPPECLACTCVSDYQPLPASKCSVTGAPCAPVCGVLGCNPVQCPDQVGVAPITGCQPGGKPTYALSSAVCAAGNGTTTSQFLFDPILNAVSAVTTLVDSATQGYACRHNNQLYAVSGAGGNTPFTYPRTNVNDVYAANKAGPAPFLQTGAFTQAVTSGCPTIGTTVNIPRHYYTIASVQFCDHIDTTANGVWKGFGTGTCQASNDLQAHPIGKYGKFTRSGLVNDGRLYPYTDQVTGAALTRTYAQEIVNYANWFAYYRLRAHAAKTTSTLAFNLLDPTYRVGFHILGTEPTPIGNGLAISWVDVKDFTLAQRNAFWTALFAVPTVTTNKTPIMSAMLRIGNLFETGSSAGLPASVNVSGPFAAAKDPFDKDSNLNLISCANNYHILFTDGFTQQIALPAVAGEKDNVTPAAWPPPGLLPDGSNNPDNVLPDLPVSTAWPKPFHWGTKAVPDTLADVGMYYWARDLRPALTNNVPSWSGKAPADIDPTKDVAWWQHVNFSAISFGAAGTLDASSQAATLAAISAGTAQWPDLTAPNNPPLPPSNKGAVAVDDLWHAALNARGTFVYAKSPLEVQYGLATILAGIANQRKSRAGAAFAGTVLSATNNIIYEATIEPGWSGDVLKVQIDPVTAAEVATLWQAGQQLSDQIRPTSATDEPWMDETKRRIVTWNGVTRVGFRETAGSLPPLSPAQMATLSPDPVTQKKMIHYLRGGNIVNMPLAPVNGFVIEGTGIGEFRSRYGKAPPCPLCIPAKPFAGGASLGDISNAQPLVVSAPIPDVFYETNDPGYFNFSHVTAAGRPDRIVAAANDGMVHVIDSADGHEVFAYVPSSLLRSAGAPDFAVDAAGKPTGLQALTFQDGGVPIYKHHFYVDSSPRSVNVDFNSAGVKGGADDWRTIVVGGMGKGGKSYYALDLTDGNAATEFDAGAKMLWEITDPDWRYTYGRPVIAKTYAFGWTVIVTSGYNNVSEEGRIYFFDPKTGAPLRAYMSVGKSCGGGNPAGLAQINGFTKDFHNQFVEQIYGGDLCGNFWRFNLSDPNSANWTIDKLAVLKDSSGVVQPVTTAPQIEIDFANGVNRYVFIGTGQLLDAIDLTVPTPAQQQTMWAIRDGSLSTPLPTASLPINARAALLPIAAGGAALPSAPNGWYHDLPTGATAERVVVDVEADANVVIYIGTQVPNDPCLIALPADIYAREFATGKALLYDGSGNPYVYDGAGGVGVQIVGLQDPVTGAITLGGLLSHEIPGTKPLTLLNPLFGGRNRLSWRALSGD